MQHIRIMCCLQGAAGKERCCADQNRDTKQQQRRQHLTDTADQLPRRQSQPATERKEKQRKECQRHRLRNPRRHERHHADFKRHRGRTRHGEKRADGQIEQQCEHQPVSGRNTRGQRLRITHPGIADRNNTEQRQADPGQEKTEHGGKDVFPRLLPQHRRKNQISGTKKQREQHQPCRPKRRFIKRTHKKPQNKRYLLRDEAGY